MKSEDNRNLILAIALSVIVMVGWNYWFGVPKLDQQRQQAQQTQSAQGQSSVVPQNGNAQPGVLQPPAAGQPTAPPSAIPAGVTITREAALALSTRVAIETPVLKGSIALTGARIDDLSLVKYHETVDPKSPNIVLFAPQGAPGAYYADFGWVAAAGQSITLPGPQTLWQASTQTLKPGAPVTLSWDNGQGLVFSRKIEIDDKYLFTVTDSVKNNGTAPIALSPYGRVSRHGTPTTLGFYVLHEGPLGYLDSALQEPSFDEIKKAKIKSFAKNEGGWLGITEKYWAAAIIPDQKKNFQAAFGANGNDPVYEAAAIGEAVALAPGASLDSQTRLFAGAKEVHTINAYGDNLGVKNFDLMIDWGRLYFITKPLFIVMDWVYKLVGNFGVTILIVTVLIKLAFFPLANKSYASMAKMKAVQPEMLRIRDQFADDKMKQQQAMMELYKKEKINPMAGCLPVLVQIPVFFALYKVLFVTIEMRHAPFFGWIKDLAAPDPTNLFNLFGLLPFTPPSMLHLGIWPIIMGVTMWVQMKMNPEPTDPIQKTMFAWMPVIFTFMLGSFPAGLVIYWAWNNTLSVLQQYAIMRKMGTKVELWDNLKATFKKG
ncbi:MAG: membrane protein insertase YidC [Proteobacteria bacterium]|nr:membrane protein insertase YidC [Pseudomonadota bacterium]